MIPRSIATPILRVSQSLDLPPILTYSDTVLYNWHIDPAPDVPVDHENRGLPTPGNIRTNTMFTNTVDEEEFYLCSSRIELKGVEALELIRMMMDEIFVGNTSAIHRISDYLRRMTTVIKDLRILLLQVKKFCRPDLYYNVVRPWLRGEDSDRGKRKWIYEGVDEDPKFHHPTELSGPSAGQSTLIHVLDIHLGVDHQTSATSQIPSFMDRMKIYMPRSHRSLLNHLIANPRPLRGFVVASQDEEMKQAYNQAVLALKEFRDAHMIITTLYIIGPAKRAARAFLQREQEEIGPDVSTKDPATNDRLNDSTLKGTGGTYLVKFLKDTRLRTEVAIIGGKV